MPQSLSIFWSNFFDTFDSFLYTQFLIISKRTLKNSLLGLFCAGLITFNLSLFLLRGKSKQNSFYHTHTPFFLKMFWGAYERLMSHCAYNSNSTKGRRHAVVDNFSTSFPLWIVLLINSIFNLMGKFFE